MQLYGRQSNAITSASTVGEGYNITLPGILHGIDIAGVEGFLMFSTPGRYDGI